MGCLREEWLGLRPGYRLTRAEGWAFKLIYEAIESLDDARAILQKADRLMRSTDRYLPGGWALPGNQTLAHVARHLSALLNGADGAAGGDEPEKERIEDVYPDLVAQARAKRAGLGGEIEP
jgi:hypothetical protein